MSAVELANVSKFYGPVEAIRDVSLSAETGELTAVLGPSGSGKSTMLSLIARGKGMVPGEVSGERRAGAA